MKYTINVSTIKDNEDGTITCFDSNGEVTAIFGEKSKNNITGSLIGYEITTSGNKENK